MKVLTGRIFLDKIDESRIFEDKDSRKFVDIILILNDHEVEGKVGVIQQNTNKGEKRIYLANLFKTNRKGAGERKVQRSIREGRIDCECSHAVKRLESKLFKDLENI